MLSLLRGMGHDAERIQSALHIVESLPPLLTQLTETLNEMATWKEIVIRGLDHLAQENAALNQAIETAGIDSEVLRAELAAKTAELAAFLEAERAEDAQDDADRREVLDRVSQLVPGLAPVEPAPVVEPPAPAPEPVVEPPAPAPVVEEPAPVVEPPAPTPEPEPVDAPSITLEPPAPPAPVGDVTFGAFPIAD